MSITAEFQKLLLQTMSADSAITSKVTGIYDNPVEEPWGTKKAYISFGASDGIMDDADCLMIRELTMQIDVWDRNVGKVNCRRIVDAIVTCLHDRQDLNMVDFGLINLRIELFQVMSDESPLTTHGVVQVTASIQEDIDD